MMKPARNVRLPRPPKRCIGRLPNLEMNDIDEFDESKLEEDFDWEEGENMFADDEEDIFGENEDEYYEDEGFDEPYDDPYDRY